MRDRIISAVAWTYVEGESIFILAGKAGLVTVVVVSVLRFMNVIP